jgi:hypothetical protein
MVAASSPYTNFVPNIIIVTDMEKLDNLRFRKIGTCGWPLIVGRNQLVSLMMLAVIGLLGSCRPARSIHTIEQADTSSSSASDLRIIEAVSDSLLTQLYLEFDTLEISIPSHHADSPQHVRVKAIKGRVSKERKYMTQRLRNTHRKDTMSIHAMQSHRLEDKVSTNSTTGTHHILWSVLPLMLIAGTAIYLCMRLYNRK